MARNSSSCNRRRHSSRRAWTLAALLSLGLACATLALLGSFRGQREPLEAVAREVATVGRPESDHRSPEGPKRTPGPQGRYRVGDVLVYRFLSRSSITMHPPGSAAIESELADTEDVDPALAANRMDTLREGLLDMKVYERRGQGWIVGFSISEPRSMTSFSLGDYPELDKALAKSLVSGEVIASLEESGRLRELWFPTDMEAHAREFFQGLLGRQQIVLPDDGSLDEWEHIESDRTGRYQAVYHREETSAGSRITKVKSHYVELHNQNAPALRLEESIDVAFEAEITLVAEVPDKIEGRELIVFRPGELMPRVEGEEYFVFERVSREFLPAVLARDTRRVRRAREGAPATLATRHVQPRPFDPDSVDLDEEILKALQICAAGRLDSEETPPVMENLVAVMQHDAESIPKVVEHLRENKDTRSLSALLLGAIGAAGTEPAQRALLEIFTTDEWPQEIRRTAVISLVQITEPIESLDGALTELHRDDPELSSTALLLLGAVGRHCASQDPDRSYRIEEYLLANADRPDLSLRERITTLEALGNLRPPESPPHVLEAYRDENELIRASAVNALAYSFDEAADQLVVHALREDPSEEVRLSAVNALQTEERPYGREALEQALTADPSEAVRREVVSGWSDRARSDETIRELLAWTARNDPSEDVRKQASMIIDAN